MSMKIYIRELMPKVPVPCNRRQTYENERRENRTHPDATISHPFVGYAPLTLVRPSFSISVIMGLAAGLNLCSFEYLLPREQIIIHVTVLWTNLPMGVYDLGLRRPTCSSKVVGEPEQEYDKDNERCSFPWGGLMVTLRKRALDHQVQKTYGGWIKTRVVF
jgi:hypothetical protein